MNLIGTRAFWLAEMVFWLSSKRFWLARPDSPRSEHHLAAIASSYETARQRVAETHWNTETAE